MVTRCRSRLAIALSFCAVTGCDATPDRVASIASTEGSSRVIGAQEKRAALALSLGNLGIMNESTSPYSRAMLCVIALESLSQRIGEMGPTLKEGPSYGELLERSRAIYLREVQAIAVRERKPPAQIALDRKQHEREVPELSSRGQIAINCLRGLTAAGTNARNGLQE